VWIEARRRVVLGHRRLAVIDTSPAGAQPMVSADGLLALTFNGEIYNHRSLRRELEEAGIEFRSRTDTEVVLALYQRDGDAFLTRLRGMFAFALWDGCRRRMLVARDPFGQKPLYWSARDGLFGAASQVQALRASGCVSLAPDPAGWTGFLLTGSVPEPFTVLREVHALPAGTFLTVDENGPGEPVRYYSVPAAHAIRGKPLAPGELEERVRHELRESVELHLVADVPLGVFLSAGIDSSVLLALAAEVSSATPRALTLAFEEFQGTPLDEAPLAEETARHYGARHETWTVGRSELRRELGSYLAAMDQPSIDGLNTYLVSRAARAAGWTVALSGVGADELFGGYPSFVDIPRAVRWGALPAQVPALGPSFRRLCRVLGVARDRPKFAGLFEFAGRWPGAWLLRRGVFLPYELADLLDPEAAREGLERLGILEIVRAAMSPDPGTDHGRVASLETGLYLRNQLLRDTDWASMAHSLEVRAPLVDALLVERLAPWLAGRPPGGGKALLAASVRPELPRAVRDRRKTGFAVPWARWFDGEIELHAWRRVPLLTHEGTPWTRRFAYALLDRGWPEGVASAA